MKNHQRLGGKLLQTNKKWSHLKQSQQNWIMEIARKDWLSCMKSTNSCMTKKQKEGIIESVIAKINDREIWIPDDEVRMKLKPYIARLERKRQADSTDAE